MAALLEIRDLDVHFATQDGDVHAVKRVSLDIAEGTCLGVVGESGSGKSQLFLAAMGLLAANGRASGSVRYRGQELLGLPAARLNQFDIVSPIKYQRRLRTPRSFRTGKCPKGRWRQAPFEGRPSVRSQLIVKSVNTVFFPRH